MTDAELIDIKDMQLAELTRTMREVAYSLGNVMSEIENGLSSGDACLEIGRCAAVLMRARAGKLSLSPKDKHHG